MKPMAGVLPLYIRQGACHSGELCGYRAQVQELKDLAKGRCDITAGCRGKREPIYRLESRLRKRARRWKEYLLQWQALDAAIVRQGCSQIEATI